MNDIENQNEIVLDDDDMHSPREEQKDHTALTLSGDRNNQLIALLNRYSIALCNKPVVIIYLLFGILASGLLVVILVRQSDHCSIFDYDCWGTNKTDLLLGVFWVACTSAVLTLFMYHFCFVTMFYCIHKYDTKVPFKKSYGEFLMINCVQCCRAFSPQNNSDEGQPQNMLGLILKQFLKEQE